MHALEVGACHLEVDRLTLRGVARDPLPRGRVVRSYALDGRSDAVLTAEGVPQPFGPASGVATAAILQALVAATVDGLLARGVTPPVLLSANIEGGTDWNDALLAEHRDRIFYLN